MGQPEDNARIAPIDSTVSREQSFSEPLLAKIESTDQEDDRPLLLIHSQAVFGSQPLYPS
jgi:hypothetical protein